MSSYILDVAGRAKTKWGMHVECVTNGVLSAEVRGAKKVTTGGDCGERRAILGLTGRARQVG